MLYIVRTTAPDAPYWLVSNSNIRDAATQFSHEHAGGLACEISYATPEAIKDAVRRGCVTSNALTEACEVLTAYDQCFERM